jgi:sarcosine oxidase subunit gamma
MQTSIRTSPLHASLAHLSPVWKEIKQMQVAWQIHGAASEQQARARLALCDASCLERFGLKGPKAAEWLKAQGLPVPEQHNHWAPLDSGGYVMRLGLTEFFLEDGPQGTQVASARQALGAGAPGVYPVRRQDAGIILAGEMVQDLLAQTCNINFATAARDPNLVLMTSMVGVSVVIIMAEINGAPVYRIWCDGTMGHYLWETLLEITQELGGGAVGLGGYYPQLTSQ